MKILSGASHPSVYVDDTVFDKLSKYALALTQRATIICDCIVDDVAGTVQVIEANLVEQTVDYLKNSSKYEEINQYIGYREDKNYGTIFAQCMIRNTLGAAHDAFEEKDFTYFEKLCEVTDWLLVGEITKPSDGSEASLHLWYMDLENRIAYGYSDPGIKSVDGFDGQWKRSSYGYYDQKEIESEVKRFCKTKTSTYGGTTYYGTGGYSSHNYSTPATPPAKSKLNKDDPDISKIV